MIDNTFYAIDRGPPSLDTILTDIFLLGALIGLGVWLLRKAIR